MLLPTFVNPEFVHPADANNLTPALPQQAPNPFDFPVFQAGKRICLGQRMVSAGLSMRSVSGGFIDTSCLCTKLIPKHTHTSLAQAIFEAKVLAVMLLQRFSFSIDPAEAERITYSLTLTMSICNSKDAAIKDRTHELLLQATPRK